MAQPVPGQDLAAEFDADWQKAMQRYNTGVNAGYTEADADTLYLAPVREKWKLIQSSPSTFTDKSKLDKINSDFEAAQESAVKNLNRSESTEETVGSRIGPLAQKWSIAASFPTSPKVPTTPSQTAAWFAHNPAMQAEEKETLSQIASGVPESEAILAHPTLLQNAPYGARWNPRLTASIGRDQRAAAKADAAPDVTKLARSRRFFTNELTTNPDLPPDVKQEYEDQISQIDSMMSPFSRGVRFTSPTDSSPAEAPQSPGSRQEFPLIGTKDEYDSLASGALYYDASGNLRRKR